MTLKIVWILKTIIKLLYWSNYEEILFSKLFHLIETFIFGYDSKSMKRVNFSENFLREGNYKFIK